MVGSSASDREEQKAGLASRSDNNLFQELSDFKRDRADSSLGRSVSIPARWELFSSFRRTIRINNGSLSSILPCKAFLSKSTFSQHLLAITQQPRNILLEGVDSHAAGGGIVLCTNDNSWYDEDIQGQVRHNLQGTTDCTVESLDGDGIRTLSSQTARISSVVNLCLTERFYSPLIVERQGLAYYWVPFVGGGLVPSFGTVVAALCLLDAIGRMHPDTTTLIHCTHGVNRTGFLCTLYAIWKDRLSPEAASRLFHAARGHPVHRDELLETIRLYAARLAQLKTDLSDKPMILHTIIIAPLPSESRMGDVLWWLLQQFDENPLVVRSYERKTVLQLGGHTYKSKNVWFAIVSFESHMSTKEIQRRSYRLHDFGRGRLGSLPRYPVVLTLIDDAARISVFCSEVERYISVK